MFENKLLDIGAMPKLLLWSILCETRVMQSREYLGQEEFRMVIAPARVAYLIGEGSVSGFIRAVQEACTRWGGVTEPIIPVNQDLELDDQWRTIAELADVDELVNVDCDDRAAQAVSKRLGLPLVSIDVIDQEGPGRHTCHPMVISQEDQQSWSQSAEYAGGFGPITGSWFYTESTDDLGDLWAIAAAGTFASAIARSQGLVVPSSPGQSTGFASRQTALDRTASQFGQHWSDGGPYTRPAVFWLCDKDPFPDCIAYWNFRALRPFGRESVPMLLLPAEKVDSWILFFERIQELLRGRSGVFPADAVLYSQEVTPDRLRTIAESWGLVEDSRNPSQEFSAVDAIAPRLPPFTYRVGIDPVPYMSWHRRYGMTTRVPIQVFRDKTSVAFNSPVRFAGSGATKVKINSDILSPFPKRPSIARLIQPESHWRDGGIELYQQALSHYEIDICVPQLREVVETLLDDATESHCLSDKGRMGQSITPSWKLERLLEPGVFEAIRSLTTLRKERVGAALDEQAAKGNQLDLSRLASEFGRLERTSQCTSDLCGVQPEVGVVAAETLVTLGWAERGCRISCERCSVTSFVPFRDTTPSARCPGCESSGRYAYTSAGITTYYRLNSLIDLASDQGVLPHLLVIAALHKRSSNTFILPGVDVSFDDGIESEVDLFGVHDGKVIAGEVKTSAAAFDEEQIHRDVKLSKRLLADAHVMACTEPLEEGAITIAEEVAQKYGVHLVILDAVDLRPVIANI